MPAGPVGPSAQRARRRHLPSGARRPSSPAGTRCSPGCRRSMRASPRRRRLRSRCRTRQNGRAPPRARRSNQDHCEVERRALGVDEVAGVLFERRGALQHLDRVVVAENAADDAVRREGPGEDSRVVERSARATAARACADGLAEVFPRTMSVDVRRSSITARSRRSSPHLVQCLTQELHRTATRALEVVDACKVREGLGPSRPRRRLSTSRSRTRRGQSASPDSKR